MQCWYLLFQQQSWLVLKLSCVLHMFWLEINHPLFFQSSSSSNSAGFGRQPAPLSIPNWSNLKPSLMLLTIKSFHIYKPLFIFLINVSLTLQFETNAEYFKSLQQLYFPLLLLSQASNVIALPALSLNILICLVDLRFPVMIVVLRNSS